MKAFAPHRVQRERKHRLAVFPATAQAILD
jgi:hypothetical protein